MMCIDSASFWRLSWRYDGWEYGGESGIRISVKSPISRAFPKTLLPDFLLRVNPFVITRKRKSDRRKRQVSHGLEIRARNSNPA